MRYFKKEIKSHAPVPMKNPRFVFTPRIRSIVHLRPGTNTYTQRTRD